MKRELIRLENVVKTFGSLTVLDEIELTIHENEFMTLLGPSGCGKTTLLRIIGGFETPDSGRVLFNGKDITNVPPNKRPINTVF
ncbi:MAG: ATP-binding cassette domain-containing protein, partial [Selenomonadaceae bacterium]|nr:ATP-binding cassette domain-containing protein [Selenomonadaceae bacterium]